MANKYFSQLTQLAAGSVASGDVIAIEDISAGETKYITSSDYATYVSSTLAASSGGWDAVADTWAYLGATTNRGTVSIPSGGTLLYGAGDKVKFTQGGTQLYFYVIDASSGTTLVLTAGNTYTLGTATISNVYYSKTENPLGFPGYFTFAPAHGGFSSAPAGGKYIFWIIEKNIYFSVTEENPGTSNATSYTITMPVAAAYRTAGGPAPRLYDNGADIASGSWSIAAGTTLMYVYRSALAAWTSSGNKYANLQGFYPYA